MRKTSIFFVIFTLLVIVFVGHYLIRKNNIPANTPPVEVAKGKCGLTIVSPAPQTVVSFPLPIHVIVDNTQAQALGCSWTVFEAQAGNVKVFDQNSQEVGFSTLTTTEDWMTANPVNYYGTLVLAGTPASNNLTLVFTEDNPSGEGPIDTFTMSVTKQ